MALVTLSADGKRRPGRRPLGDMAMSNRERQRKYRARRAAGLPVGGTGAAAFASLRETLDARDEALATILQRGDQDLAEFRADVASRLEALSAETRATLEGVSQLYRLLGRLVELLAERFA
jgi:hypothetical protein